MAHTYPHDTVTQIATRCFREDIFVTTALERAGIAASTWSRWRRDGTKPQQGTLDRLHVAIEELVALRDAGVAAAPHPAAG